VSSFDFARKLATLRMTIQTYARKCCRTREISAANEREQSEQEKTDEFRRAAGPGFCGDGP
ncbi:MAG: hypothetical protein JW849_01110, partial [Phycisphaerae bacterium]|nr:hypothetical protein [Phycisphaerae bacterium]